MKHCTKYLFSALACAALATGLTAHADTVLLDENFDNDYTSSFPYLFDADANAPHPSIADIFYSNAMGTTMPWWVCMDAKGATDKFMASHAYYRPAGTSNDWMISKPLDIDSEGYLLEFDAQCVDVRGDIKYQSDLCVFITSSLLDTQNVPTEPTYVFKDVPYGDDPDICGGDWTHYTVPLDDYAGQTIYVNFVNKNDDRDILCVDNVKVWRHDPVELSLTPYEMYCADAHTEVGVTVDVTGEDGLRNWTLSLYSADKASAAQGYGEPLASWTGDVMACGASETITYSLPVEMGVERQYAWVMSADNCPAVRATGSVTGMAFVPVHRIFFEETTSLFCGNCPMGIYTVESLLSDPDLGPLVLPVSVHIAAMGYDPMATADYYSLLPENNAAPMLFVERVAKPDGLNPTYDCEYNPENKYSFAYRIAQKTKAITPIDVAVDAEWVIDGADTTAVSCTARVTPAYNIEGVDYRVAFILTENNVGLDNNPYWIQTNYLAGGSYESRCGGWCDLPKDVINARYHDVARAVSNFYGQPNSLPADMAMSTEYAYTAKVKIPNTDININGRHVSDPIRRSNCEITAIVIDGNTGLVVNGARVAMGENATHRYTAADLVRDIAGVTHITIDGDDSQAVYYDITGRRVSNPGRGVYIKRTASSVSKMMK